MIAHILLKKKEREERKRKKRKKNKITVEFLKCSVVYVSVFLIQLFSSNLLPYYFHTLLNSESLYLSCLQLKILKTLFSVLETLKMS